MKALEKGRQIFTESFTRKSHVIKFIIHIQDSIPLVIVSKIFNIKNIVKEIFMYNYYMSRRVFQNCYRILRNISEVGHDEKPAWNLDQ